MNDRRRLLAALLAGAASLCTTRGHAARRWRIVGVTYRGRTPVEDGFEAYLAARGIDVEITWLDLARDPARLPGVVAEIRRLRPDLVYTWGTTVSLGVLGPFDAADTTPYVRDIPAVFTLVAAPVAARLVPALTSSGRNITGVSHMAPLAVQLRAMRAYQPFSKLGLIYTPSEENSRLIVEALRAEAANRKYDLHALAFAVDAGGRPLGGDGLALLARLKAEGVEWLYLPPDSYLTTQAPDLLAAATALGLPSFSSTEALVAAGALTGVVSRYSSVGQFTGFKAEQILVGGRAPAAIAVETLSRFSLQVNLQVARRLGLPPPLAMFDYAELIEASPGEPA